MVFKKIGIILDAIKFEHSVFALPFAYMGAFLARGGAPTFSQMAWITLAIVGARSFAMGMNRLVDKEIDARNPRTCRRALPTGLLAEVEMLAFIVFSFGIFLLALYQLAPLTRWLWPLVVIPFVVYPYTKRFTWASHFLLGMCLGLAPVGAWVALRNRVDLLPLVLGMAVACWVAGFDIIYACQDVKIDQQQGLYSIAASFGVER